MSVEGCTSFTNIGELIHFPSIVGSWSVYYTMTVGSGDNWETPGVNDSASDYLHDTLGDVLAEILLECANNRPDDPISFVASAFER